MKSTPQQVFVRRVEYALSWAILIGLTASLNLIPSQQRSGSHSAEATAAQQQSQQRPHLQQQEGTVRQVITTHAMVVPRIAPNLSKRERVVQWFAAFDQIRERAKMSPMEKASAIRIWASSFATTSEGDKEDARLLLTSMVQRYTRASQEMTQLTPIPETKQLQAGYSRFFNTAKGEFEEYVVALDRQSTKAALQKMADGRKALASIDVRNKNLDRRTRQQYNIPQID